MGRSHYNINNARVFEAVSDEAGVATPGKSLGYFQTLSTCNSRNKRPLEIST